MTTHHSQHNRHCSKGPGYRAAELLQAVWWRLEAALELESQHKDSLSCLISWEEEHDSMWADHATHVQRIHAEMRAVKHLTSSIFTSVLLRREAEHADELAVSCCSFILMKISAYLRTEAEALQPRPLCHTGPQAGHSLACPETALRQA